MVLIKQVFPYNGDDDDDDYDNNCDDHVDDEDGDNDDDGDCDGGGLSPAEVQPSLPGLCGPVSLHLPARGTKGLRLHDDM